MRPIKFRVYNLVSRSWIRRDGDSAPWAEIVDLGAWQDETRFAISQYTGLKDRSGKEIWEGDIVRYPSDTPSIHRSNSRFYCSVVEYEIDSYEPIRAGFRVGGDYATDETTEVVGNQRDNPELLI